MPKLWSESVFLLLLSLGASKVPAHKQAGEVATPIEMFEARAYAQANDLVRTRLDSERLHARRQSKCDSNQPVRIFPQAIGPLPVTATIRELLTICRGVPTIREAEEHTYPAIEFRVGGLTVLASQTIEADSVNRDNPADTWEVKGTSGLLPMDMPLNSNWAALRRAYGAAVVSTVFDEVQVMFCRFPKMFLHLDADREALLPIDGTELTRIPPDSKVVRVLITLWPFGSSRCAGAEH